MADKKISELTSATTPLTGTEELAIVQGGVTKKVAASDLGGGGGGGIDVQEITRVLYTTTNVPPDAQSSINNIFRGTNDMLLGTIEANLDLIKLSDGSYLVSKVEAQNPAVPA